MTGENMYRAYRNVLLKAFHYGTWELNARTDTKICMIEGGYSFKLALDRGYVPVAGNRSYYPHVAAAEVAWQLMGTKDPEFIMRKAPKVWGHFIEDGELKTAYGYRWRHHFGRDQLQMAIDELKNNPSNRQLYISAWDPAADGLGAPDQPKNIPCPIGFSVSRVEDKIHMSMFLRSSDLFVGLPYDVMGYALMVDAIAASCNCTPGTLHVTMAHPHFYEPHFQDIERNLTGDQKHWFADAEPTFPGWTVGEIMENPDGYVNVVRRLAKRVMNNPFNPLPEVIV